jgi:hypothetical protein
VSHEALTTYLHDHLAGARAAVDLLESLRDQHRGQPVGHFAAEILADVRADQAVLQALAERAGSGPSSLKEAAAWITARLARLKLGATLAGDLGVFEALETLALGIQGKLALWKALRVIAPAGGLLSTVDLDTLAARAEAQHTRVEERRLGLARTALRPAGYPPGGDHAPRAPGYRQRGDRRRSRRVGGHLAERDRGHRSTTPGSLAGVAGTGRAQHRRRPGQRHWSEAGPCPIGIRCRNVTATTQRARRGWMARRTERRRQGEPDNNNMKTQVAEAEPDSTEVERDDLEQAQREPAETIDPGEASVRAFAQPVEESGSAGPSRRPPEDEIRLGAYYRYLERGDGAGDEISDWLEAEAELREGSPDSGRDQAERRSGEAQSQEWRR